MSITYAIFHVYCVSSYALGCLELDLTTEQAGDVNGAYQILLGNSSCSGRTSYKHVTRDLYLYYVANGDQLFRLVGAIRPLWGGAVGGGGGGGEREREGERNGYEYGMEERKGAREGRRREVGRKRDFERECVRGGGGVGGRERERGGGDDK